MAENRVRCSSFFFLVVYFYFDDGGKATREMPSRNFIKGLIQALEE